MLKRWCMLLLAVCALFALGAVYNLCTMPLIGLLRSMDVLEQKTTGLAQRASTFDEKKVLQHLKAPSINKDFFRFDQNIAMAKFDEQALPDFSTGSYSHGFGFEDSGDTGLVFHETEYEIRDTTCFVRTSASSLITSAQDLALPRAELREIEIRLKSRQGKKVLLGLSSNLDVQWSERNKVVQEAKVGEIAFMALLDVCVVPFDIVSDNTFHIYTINLEKSLADPRVNFDDFVRKIFIKPPEINGNEIEIDYIRFINRKEQFSRAPFGNAYVKKNNEYRSVLYMNTPCSLRYTTAVSLTASHLSFGTGVLMPGDPVEFMLAIEGNGVKRVLLRETAENPDAWSFVTFDLSEYAGQTVDIVFSVTSNGGNIAFWSNPVLYSSLGEKFNVIIVLEDAMRADHLSLYGYTARQTSPFREKFSQGGVVFEYAFSQATATRPSIPSFMTSLYPAAAGVGRGYETLSDKHLTLAEIMRSQGYATASIIQNPNAGYYNGLHQGFSRLYDDIVYADYSRKTEDVYGSRLSSWLDDVQGRNFFLYLHVIDPHGSYDPPAPFDSWFREANPSGKTLAKDLALDPVWVDNPTQEGRRLLYDGEIRNNDHWFEKFYAMLASRGLLQNTLIVFMSDHGENLGERGVWGHQPPGYIQGLRVPLVMVYPDRIPEGLRIKAPVQLLDIMPTILDIAGIDTGEMVIQGDSLLTLIDGSRSNFWDERICFSEEVLYRQTDFEELPLGSIFVGNWHMLNSEAFIPSKLCNNKALIAPLLFKAFQFADDPAEARSMKSFFFDPVGKIITTRVMQNFHQANKRIAQAFAAQDTSKVEIDPHVQEKLRALGYLQ